MTAATDPGGALVRAFADHGYRDFTGVPCSLLKGAFRALEDPGRIGLAGRIRYVPAPREDSAIGLACGLAVAGQRAVVLMQNSGFGNCVNVLTSFSLIYSVHVPLVVSWRGRDGNDAVEHDVMGRELISLIELLGLRWTLFDPARPRGSVDDCLRGMAGGRRTAVLVVADGA